MSSASPYPGPWPRRLAWTLAVCTLGLLLAGGLVTTYRVGMAVPDWPTTFGQGMFRYPLAAMLDDSGVAIEHSHRLLASGVGVLCILMVLVSALGRAPRSVRVVSAVTLLAVCVQGVLGGTRVLENSRGLAFLHGAFAQLFYALVATLWVLTSPRWVRSRRSSLGHAGAARAARTACAAVYVQIVLGAWLRHSGRVDALAWHLAIALAAVAAVLTLCHRLAAAPTAPDGPPFVGLRRWLLGALATQVGLGIAATAAILGPSGGFEGSVSLLEAVTATLHVAVGALLFAGCVASALWTSAPRRVDGRALAPAAHGLEGVA